MNDLPTRLRTNAEEHDRLGRKLWLCGIPDGAEMRERARLMRAAADEIERLGAAALPVDDTTRSLNDSALPSVMIWDGGEAYDELTGRNALPATDPRSLDLDACAIAVGIYRAMTAAAASHLKPSPASSPIVKTEEGGGNDKAPGAADARGLASGWGSKGPGTVDSGRGKLTRASIGGKPS